MRRLILLLAVFSFSFLLRAQIGKTDVTESAYIPNSGDGTISVIDTTTDTVNPAPIVIGSNPQSASLSPTAATVYVTSGFFAGDVSVIDTTTLVPTVISFAVENNPQMTAFSPDGTIAYVTNAGSSTISVIDTTTQPPSIIATISLDTGPQAAVFSQDGAIAYVTRSTDQVTEINTATRMPTVSYSAGENVKAILLSSNGTRLYISNTTPTNTVTVVDTATRTIVQTIPVGNDPRTMALSPDGRFLYVANFSDSTISVIDTTTNTVIRTFSVAPELNPEGLALTSDGKKLYVINFGSNSVSIYDVTSDSATFRKKVNVGNGPLSFGYFVTVRPSARTSSSSVTFPPQKVGTSSSSEKITLTNNGNGLLTITSITASGDFSQTNDCGTSLTVGASCTITITFTPTGDGERTGFITIIDNASDSPQVIALSGIGSTGENLSGGCTLHPTNNSPHFFSLNMFFASLFVLAFLRIQSIQFRMRKN